MTTKNGSFGDKIQRQCKQEQDKMAALISQRHYQKQEIKALDDQ